MAFAYPALSQWREVQEQLRLNKIYQGLRVSDDRPRYIFNAWTRDQIRKMPGNRKIKSIFVPGHGMKFYRPIFGASPATYYVKNGGDDEADGLSDGNAWATIAKVNATELSAGDVVQFKCGSTWTNDPLYVKYAGSNGSEITYGKYGTGSNPIIAGAAPGWVGVTDYYAAGAISYIIIEYLEVSGWDDEIDTGLGFYFKQTSNLIIRHFSSHNNLENGVVLADCADATVEWGSSYSNGTNGILFIGSGDASVHNTDCYSNGRNGIQFTNSDSAWIYNNTCYGNSTEDNLYAGIGIEVDCRWNKIYYNLLYENLHAGIVTNSPDNEYYNNTCYENTEYELLLTDWGTTAPEDNIFKNNIFYCSGTSRAVTIMDQGIVAYTGLDNTFDHNLYFYEGGPDVSNMVFDQTQDPDKDYSFATWVSEAGMEANGVNSDPLLLDAANDDYHLKSNSPCVDAGIDVGLLLDRDGVPIGRGTAPDMGCYETLKGGPRRL